ncbi:hypothetical protein [Sphingopyxis terrae]|uniref:hypothetical protein n=1 Tax=Sphingopyxis terrae TaxID=33052 RepID=UPI00363071DF
MKSSSPVATMRTLMPPVGTATPTPAGWARLLSVGGDTLVMPFKWGSPPKVATGGPRARSPVASGYSAGCGAASPCGRVSSPFL